PISTLFPYTTLFRSRHLFDRDQGWFYLARFPFQFRALFLLRLAFLPSLSADVFGPAIFPGNTNGKDLARRFAGASGAIAELVASKVRAWLADGRPGFRGRFRRCERSTNPWPAGRFQSDHARMWRDTSDPARISAD